MPLPQYERNLRDLVAELEKSGAVLIWASATPVPEGRVSPPRVPADVRAYNEAALRVMKEQGVRVNDLYSFILPTLARHQRPVNVHFTASGSESLAERVAAEIDKALSAGK